MRIDSCKKAMEGTNILLRSASTSSSVVKYSWEVFVWGFGVLFLSCVCVSVSGVLFSSERARGLSTPGGPPCLCPDRLSAHRRARARQSSDSGL